jgi:hypothetical protein
MTFNTHLTLGRAQEMIRPCSRLMRRVTFEAVAFTGVGMMGTTLIQIGMAFEAQVALFTFQERSAVAGMGHVTRRTVPLYNGGMPLSLARFVLHHGMAAQAEALL